MAESSSRGTETDSTSVESGSSSSSLILDVPKCPAASELARKRKLQSNPPSGVKRRTTRVKGKNEPTSVSPQDRLREFKDEPLTPEFYFVPPVVSLSL